jgi:Type II intron maturase/AI2M/AI1M-like, HNH endonuclease
VRRKAAWHPLSCRTFTWTGWISSPRQSSSRNIPEGKAGKPILPGPRWRTRWRPPGGAATVLRYGSCASSGRACPPGIPVIPATAGSGTSATPTITCSGSPARRPEAEQIKQRLAGFLRDDLKLELSAGKTLITHARTQAARFLGYDITVQHSPCRPSVNGVIGLRVPRAVITAKAAPYLRHGKPGHRPELMNLDDLEIISAYGAEYRGLVQYYLLAGNVSRLHRLRWAAETSMLKTLAAKHRSTVTKMARKYKAVTATQHGPRTCFEARTERPGRKPLVARFGGIPLKRQKRAVLDDRLPAPAATRRKELVTRLLRGRCEWCQRHRPVQAHQVRKLADLGTPGPAQPGWASLMARMRRKTLIVCAACHQLIHDGKPAAICTS